MLGVQVSTVDAFQGGERDIILLSTVRTNSCGFIDNEKYVAINKLESSLVETISSNKRFETIATFCAVL